MKSKVDTGFTLNDTKARMVGIPVIAIAMHFVFRSFPEKNASEHLIGIAIALVSTTIYWQGIRKIWFVTLYKLPAISQTMLRMLAFWSSMLVYTFSVSAIIEFVIRKVIGLSCRFDDIYTSFLISLIPTVIVSLIYESVYFFMQWTSNVQKTEALARENVQSQLDALKNQLDPHFLFNSLNTLASLIDDQNEAAQKYLEQLSDVYRYVLISREKNTVSLEEEMEFLDAYLYLNKARFRDNLLVEKEIPKEAMQMKIAPLSLQLLVENALKHNIISKEKPLKIRISESNQSIKVENNLQPKHILGHSTKVGLTNIINRYRLLTSREVVVSDEPSVFSVVIPLL